MNTIYAVCCLIVYTKGVIIMSMWIKGMDRGN